MGSYYAAGSPCAASVGLVPAAEAPPAELYRAPPQGGLGPDWQAVTADLQEEHQMNQMIVSLLVVLHTHGIQGVCSLCSHEGN